MRLVRRPVPPRVHQEQVADAVRAIETADGALAEKVRRTESEIDRRELELDRECMLVLARRQPAASDLRLVLMVTRATADLERIGDEATKIARRAIQLVLANGLSLLGVSAPERMDREPDA